MCNPFQQFFPSPPPHPPQPSNTMSGAEQFLITGPALRKKVRIVCVSDTHNSSPNDGAFKVPPGDVLIHAGDMTNQGSYKELKRAVEWIGACPHEVKIVVSGNHDGVTLDPQFFEQHGKSFHNQIPQSHEDNLALFTGPEAAAKGIVYLNHEFRTITLRDGRTFSVFGSPWVPTCGLWGFTYREACTLSESLWNAIPLDTDIIITHTPPKCHLDSTLSTGSAGCEHLRQALATVRPLLHVFGHIHAARGVERVSWDLASRFVRYKESYTVPIEDPAPESARQFVVDLTGKKTLGNVIINDRTKDGRRETCLVNAAIATGPWRKGGGGRRGKAVVVDVEMLVVERVGVKEEAKEGDAQDNGKGKETAGTGI